MQTNVNTTKPKLLPVRVPWAIVADTPFLKVQAAEGDAGHPTAVTASAEFAVEHREQKPGALIASGPTTSIKIVQPPTADEKGSSSEPTEGPYQLIRITFTDGLWVRFYPSYADAEVVEEAAYDWSALPNLMEQFAKSGIEGYRRRFYSMWRTTGVCPNPRMYEVERSTWPREVNVRNPDFKHYLILGHDAYVEVIAKGWKWESVRPLPGY